MRLLLVGIGLVSAVTAAEVSLRLAGVLYRLGRSVCARPTWVANQPQDSRYRILCIGDSFTFGIGAPAGFSYPEQLARLLQETAPMWAVEVVNRGVPAENSSQILHRLEKALATLHPKAVVILAGRNNVWNTEQASLPPPWRGSMARCTAFLERLKVYRLLTMASMGWHHGQQARIEEGRAPSVSLSTYLHIDLSPEEAQAALERLGRQPPSEPTCIEMGGIYLGRRRYKEALASFKRALDVNPESERAYLGLALAHILSGDLSTGEAFATVAIQHHPHSSLAYRLRGVTRFLRNDQKEALEDFETTAALNPDFNQLLANLDEQLHTPQRMERYVDRWFTQDLEAMVTLLERQAVRVVLLTYPISPNIPAVQSVSPIVQAVGARHHVEVVDLESVFHRFPGPAQKELMAQDHFHPNTEGYRLMAEPLAQLLLTEEAMGRGDRTKEAAVARLEAH